MSPRNFKSRKKPAFHTRKYSARFASIRRTFLCITISWIANTALLSAGDRSLKAFPPDPGALAMIRDPETSETDFLKATRQLGYLPAEDTSTLAEIVGSPKYSDRRRRLALFELLKRHVKSRMTLFDLAKLIPRNTLLDDNDVWPAGFYSGPSRPDLSDSGRSDLFYAKIISGVGYGDASLAIVLNLSDPLNENRNRESVLAALHGEQSDNLKELRILDLHAFSRLEPQIDPVP